MGEAYNWVVSICLNSKKKNTLYTLMKWSWQNIGKVNIGKVNETKPM